jgi:HAD superfamily hydrolase (TIGR01549 family)
MNMAKDLFDIDVMIFDVDGTLVDSARDIACAVNSVRKGVGLSSLPEETIISYVGTGVEDLIRMSLGEENLGHFEKAMKFLAEYYAANPAKYSRLYPNVTETLEFFRNKRKFVMSNRKSVFAKGTLTALGINDYFEGIFGADSENCRKPSSCMFDGNPLLAGMDRSKALMIGDMDIDILTGKAVGAKTCWVSYGLGKKESVAPLNPDMIVGDLAELKGLLK